MQIRDGYKQTEIGVIPNDWSIVKLGDIANVFGGGTPSSFVNAYWNGDINWYTPTEIGKNKYTYESVRKITKEGFDNCSTRILPSGTILFTSRAGIGDVSILMKEGCTNQGFQSFVSKNNIYNEYLYYKVSTLKNVFLQNASGSTFLEISPNKIKAIQIPLPPTKAEQTAIAKALSDADALITSLEKLIEKKQAIKQGAMQQLLKPKEGWVVKKMGGLISLIIDNRGKTPPLANEGFPLIEVNAIYKQGKSPNYSLVSKYVDQQTYINWFRDGHPEKEDILVVTVGSAGVTSFINEEIGCIAQNIIALRIIKEISSEYVYYFTLTRSFSDQVTSVLMGAVQPSLKVPHLKEFEIFLPSTIEEQRDLAQIFSDMDTEILALEQKCSKYKLIKQGMMQELLTGKTRLI